MTIWHYTECGLDHVVIETSVTRDDAGDDVIAIPAIGLLHRAIAEGVINTMGVLTGREFRFLRTEMGLTHGLDPFRCEGIETHARSTPPSY